LREPSQSLPCVSDVGKTTRLIIQEMQLKVSPHGPLSEILGDRERRSRVTFGVVWQCVAVNERPEGVVAAPV